MTSTYRPPRLLKPADDLGDFICRSSEQTTWLRRHGHQSASTGTTKVFVVVSGNASDDMERVVAFYAWCMAHLEIEDAPTRLRKGSGRYPQPVALLARLGVDTKHEGNGLGAGLLVDVITRVVTMSESIGCGVLLFHAEDANARSFYRHLIPELSESPTDPLHLVLLLKDARKTLLG